ncbi:reverse transcriptase-like protein [Bacillus sp. JCM 19034]|uniref:reverse transcriptase-like protein n=1 Tax=Bacillus sp. JCM 19034 TaxID=1481928 RepID=UPI00078316DF|nr:reverse transcriptase-like protein [Bacillus sp. JCM 19034]
MKVKIEWVYVIHKSKKRYEMATDWLTIEAAFHLLQDLQQSGRMKSYQVIDQYDSSWSIKDMKNFLNQQKTIPQNAHAYIDGGFNPHTAASGIGWVIYYEQNQQKWRHRQNDQLDLLTDNNEAEYAALYRCLQTCEELELRNQLFPIYSDSLTVIKQASGEWPCYEENYQNWLKRIDDLADKINLKLEYHFIERNQNKEAHKLATQALNGTIIESKHEKHLANHE